MSSQLFDEFLQCQHFSAHKINSKIKWKGLSVPVTIKSKEFENSNVLLFPVIFGRYTFVFNRTVTRKIGLKLSFGRLLKVLSLTLSIWPVFSAKFTIFCKEPTLMYVEDGDHGLEVSSTKEERNIAPWNQINIHTYV